MNLLDDINVLLVDLDNTLLFMDEKEFVISYATNLAIHFNDVIQDPKEFIHYLLEGTKYMIQTKGSEINISKFFQYFVPHCNGLSQDIIYKRFFDFYTNEFDNVRHIVIPSPFTPKIIDKALKKGLKIVIATNPIFPEIATKKRLQWAGLTEYINDFLLITHGEQFNTTKPDVNYYKQILDITNRNAEECLMVGNDLYNDGVASLIGMKFYQIITNSSIDESDFLSRDAIKSLNLKKIKVHAKGTLEDFYNLL